MSEFQIQIERLSDAEIVHHASAVGVVVSRGSTIRCLHADGSVRRFHLPQRGWKRWTMMSRHLRRLLRLDKCVVVPVEHDGRWVALIVVRGGVCYHIDLDTDHITPTFTLRQSRNPLHQSICRSGCGWYFQGEYGANPQRQSVPVHRSLDEGRSWQTIYEFPSGKARHIHGCFWDPFERKVWICTGDFENENHLLATDEEFKNIEWLGDGTQSWRTCHLLFAEKAIFWGMDSQLETSYICRLDRASRRMERIKAMPGPVWYAKALDDGWYLAASVVENGPGVHDQHGHIFASRDGTTWHDVYQARKDRWPMPLFKNGVINFADGNQTSKSFYFSAEALSGIDGRTYRGSLIEP